jgi:hypothetical protein
MCQPGLMRPTGTHLSSALCASLSALAMEVLTMVLAFPKSMYKARLIMIIIIIFLLHCMTR